MKVLLAVLALAALGLTATPRESAADAASVESPDAHEALQESRRLESHHGWPRWVLDLMEEVSPEAFMRHLSR